MVHIEDQMLNLAKEAARKAGRILLDNFGRVEDIRHKDTHDLVTNVDILAERCIISMIRTAFPGHDILSEEEGEIDNGSIDYRWIVDPLDGTNNYAAGLHQFGVAVAVQRKGDTIIGVIYLPIYDELYWAVSGKGAYCNGRRLISRKLELDDTFLIFDSGLAAEPEQKHSYISALLKIMFGIRIYGVATYNLTAIAAQRGSVHLFFEPKPWDIAAGALIVEESGGKVTDFDGNRYRLDGKDLIITNGVPHDQILASVRNVSGG